MKPDGASAAEGRGKKSGKDGDAKTPPPSLPPLKPQKRLLIVLAIALAVWVVWLIWLYARTVYPMRHGNQATPETQEIERQ